MADAAVALLELERELSQRPTAFGFFQAVHLLERMHPDREPVGRYIDPQREVVRFSVHRRIGFPASEIQRLELAPEGPASMTVNFLGLIGPQGVLPHHYTLLSGERERSRSRYPAFGDFLDLFHHRILSLFYRAWRRSRLAMDAGGADDQLAEHVLDLAGVGLPEQRKALPFDEVTVVHYAGLLSSPHRSAVGLEQLLEDLFAVPVEVRQFEGAWFPLSERDLCELGEDEDAASRLGGGAVIGDEIWDSQSRVRIRIGPLSLTQYEHLLPTGDWYQQVREIARYYGNDEFEFELQPVLTAAEVPGLTLGGDDEPRPLGWSTWIRSSEFPHDADDTVLPL